MTSATISKGSTVLATLRFVEVTYGAELQLAVLAALPNALRSRLVGIAPTAELPYAELLALWRAADQLLHPRDPLWMERSGAFSIESTGVQLYSGILRKRSPHEFLTQSVSLFQLYYYPGDMDVVDEDAGRAVLRMTGFDSQDVLFCRRQTGGLQQALVQAGGEAPRVKHVRCAHLGDAFCEWELVWRVDGKEGQDSRSPWSGAPAPG
ncbi:MAG: hypothetical protein IPF98_24410 [Gemmatimonadetes bacterium]|nr:hypothetical protein [Gemmatimonadota bacterium]